MIGSEAPNRLLVEGKDDQHSIIHLMKRHGLDWDADDKNIPFIYPCEKLEILIQSISVSAKTHKKLGLILDANSSLSNRWSSIVGKLKDVNISAPPHPSNEGTILEGIDSQRKIGIWLMPNNSDPGKLEDFIATLVPEDDPCWPYAKEVVVEAKKRGAKFSESDRGKSEIHTWLAWQECLGRPFGTAITAEFLKPTF